MLISDSMPLLWLSYLALSLFVLVTGYLGIRWLPRLPRFAITGLVAGLLWMPAGFTLSRIEGQDPYEGLAPAVVVSGIAFLQNASKTFGSALVLLLLGAGLGIALGALLWGFLRQRRSGTQQEHARQDRPQATSSQRRDPMVS
ncbi:hypothetical protein [Halomonas sp. PR-M31]|uniref:hypothetical protein n=1 Tax=Halomonas sp. PR-M31 TaxID=1471202 RepID=UPI00065085A2|nr:hypothetical protein [Halomonas sp. PR-M31]